MAEREASQPTKHALVAASATAGQPEGRSQAGEQLRRSEEDFRLLVESVRDYAIFMLAPDGKVASWNAGAEHLKGYQADEVLDQHFSIFYTAIDRETDHPAAELRIALANGVYREDGWRVRKDGSVFWAGVVITALRDAQGRHVGFANVTRDLTERRESALALERSNQELEQRVQQRTAELEAFSYSVSHDLRAPLRALDGFSKLLLERASDRMDEQARDYLQRIAAAAKRMSQLTDALLGLSRLTRAVMHRTRVDISALAASVVADLRQSEPARQVEVSIEPELVAHADPRLLRIALENLLRNAWKFTRGETAARIELGSTEHDGARAYFIRDNGTGFDMAYANKLFIPFQRLHRAKRYDGTGIGLAIVARVVERHSGKVWADAAPGKGATFYFVLGAGSDR